MKPFLGWAGSKFRCHKEIISEFPIKFGDYYEPFLGSGSIFFNLYNCKRIFGKAFLSDLNQNLIKCFEAVRDEPERLSKVLLHCCTRNSEEFYYEMRKQIANPAIFIYVNRAGFSSLYRENSSGDFNVPWRKKDFVTMKKTISHDTECVRRCSDYLNTWCKSLTVQGWESALTSVKEGDLVYCDPPYLKYTETSFTKYVAGDFTLDNHIWLNNFLKTLKNERKCHIYLSNSYTDIAKKVYGEPFKIIGLADSMKSTASYKDKRLEGLWRY